jgi:FkbM family methyltransferase
MDIATGLRLVRQYGAGTLARAGVRDLRGRWPRRRVVSGPVAVEPALPSEPVPEIFSDRVVASGATFRVRPNSSDHGILDEVQAVYLAPLAQAGIEAFEDVVDLGGHIGGFSIQLAKTRTVRGSITAIEPHPENFGLLDENVRTNGLGDATATIHGAVSTQDGVARLAFADDENTGGHHLTSNVSRQAVEVRTVDALGLIRRPGTVIKIDIEGWELPVLRRLRPRLDMVRAIVGELHSTRYAVPADSVALLERHGFAVTVQGDPRIPSFIAVARP